MKIILLNLARNDLQEIIEYLSGFGENPPKKFRANFEKFCSQVMDMPYMFIQYEHNHFYRKAVIAFDYLVFYQIDEKKGIVKIYRVLHNKRNFEPLLETKQN
jgi:plasmid stabilization system protein ParE